MAPGADVPLVDTRCTICETEGNASELFAPNLDASAFTSEVFSARRMPDRIHYRMVKCRSCGLIRSDPVLATEALAALYAESTFTYEAEVANLRATYSRYLRRAQAYVGGNATMLELGCGNGFMLEEAMAIGFKDARGVEPGQSTVDAAPPGVREKIVVDAL